MNSTVPAQVIGVEDSVVRAVINKFIGRHLKGKQKYGTTLDRTDVSVMEWIQHAQEEHSYPDYPW